MENTTNMYDVNIVWNSYNYHYELHIYKLFRALDDGVWYYYTDTSSVTDAFALDDSQRQILGLPNSSDPEKFDENYDHWTTSTHFNKEFILVPKRVQEFLAGLREYEPEVREYA